MVNIGIVGIGFMGMTHYKAMAQVEGGQVAAIVSRDPPKACGRLARHSGQFWRQRRGAGLVGDTVL